MKKLLTLLLLVSSVAFGQVNTTKKITFKEGETPKIGIVISGLSSITRVEVTFRNSLNAVVRKFSTVDTTITLSDSVYTFSFTDLQTIGKAGRGTWQVEIRSEAGVKKTDVYTYEIYKATTLTGSTTPATAGGYNYLFEWDFTPITPTFDVIASGIIYVARASIDSAVNDAQAAEASAIAAKDLAVSANSTAQTAKDSALSYRNVAQASATTATNQAAIATTKAGEAATSEANAAISASIAAAAQRVYINTTAGLAATTNGQYFYVPVSGSNTLLTLYLNSAGVASAIGDYPSKSLVESGFVKYTVNSVTSTNFLNPSSVTSSQFVNATGALSATTASFATLGYITWGANTQFRAALNGVAAIVFSVAQYDAAYTFLAGSYQGPDNISGAITKAVGAVYFRVSYRVIQVNQFNWGASVLPYEAYFPTYISSKVGEKDYNDNTVVFKPNLDDEDFLSFVAQSGGSSKTIAQLDNTKLEAGKGVSFVTQTTNPTNWYDFTNASATNGFIANSAGAISTSSPGTFHPSQFIAWGVETTAKIGLQGAVPSTGAYSALQYDASFAPITASWSGVSANLLTITKYSGAVYFRVTLREGQQDQINFGASVLPYSAYFAPIIVRYGATTDDGIAAAFKPDVSDATLQAAFPSKDYVNSNALQKEGVWSAYNIVTVKKDGTGNYTTIQAALNSITDASPTKRYEVQVYDNHYAYTTSDYNLISTGASAIFGTKDYVKVRGIGERKIIYGELPTNLTNADYAAHQTVYLDGHAELENLYIIAKNTRYAIHYERANGATNWNKLSKLKNCKVEHLGCLDVPSGERWTAPDALGQGTTTGVQNEFEGVEIVGARHGFRSHANTLSTFPNRFKFDNCVLTSTLDGGFAAFIDNSPPTTEKRFVELNNTQINGVFYFNNTTSSLVYMDKVLPSIRISGKGNTPTYFDNSQNVGRVLRITSSTTGTASYVRVVSDAAGLLGNPTALPGTLGLSGSVYGDAELVDSGTDKRNLIGHRLGNCTSVNKTLVLNIDGVNRTVTFAQNYGSGLAGDNPLVSATTILAEINSALSGFAVADYFYVNSEYYPELSDVLFYKSNSGAAHIPKGSLVKFTGLNRCRIATAGETADGVAIDDIVVSPTTVLMPGRIVKNCILSKNLRFAPLFESGSSTFVEGDVFKVSANGKLEKDTSGVKTSFARALNNTYIQFQ